MNQVSSSPSAATLGAAFMLTASLAFAGSNVLQSVLPWQFGMSSTGMAFWQYVIASVAGAAADPQDRHPEPAHPPPAGA